LFKRNDYVKRRTASPFDGTTYEGDPPFEYGRIRIAYGGDSDEFLVYWFGIDGPNSTGWSLKRATSDRLLLTTRQEYFQHCLKYGAEMKS
jgi:hypothetical protein